MIIFSEWKYRTVSENMDNRKEPLFNTRQQSDFLFFIFFIHDNIVLFNASS